VVFLPQIFFPALRLPFLGIMADTSPAKKSRPIRSNAKATPDENPCLQLIRAIAASDLPTVRSVLEDHAQQCKALLNPESYGTFELPTDCTGIASGGAGAGAGAGGGAAAGAGAGADAAAAAAAGAGGVGAGVVYTRPPYCLLHWATQLACKEGNSAGPAHKIVQVLVDNGANLWGCKDVEDAVTEVVESYKDGEFGHEFDLSECNDGALSVVSGVRPTTQQSGYHYGVAGYLPLHEALRRGSVELVRMLCTPHLLNDVRLVLKYFDEENMREGQYMSLLAFVTTWRKRREDGTGLAVVHFLVERMGVSPLDLESFDPGCGGSVWPVLHGLVHATVRQPLPLPEGFVAETEKMLAFLTSKYPRLALAFDRDGDTAPVLAAFYGLTSFVLLAVRAVRDKSKALAPVDTADSDFQEDFGDTREQCGATVPGPHEWHPTQVLVAAAHAGELATVCAVLTALRKHITRKSCEHNDIPLPVVAVNAAKNEPEHLEQLRALLIACQECPRVPVYDVADSGPLHLAACCKPLGVVECVGKFATERCPEMLTKPNREGFTPLQVAVKRLEAAEKDLVETSGRVPVSAPDVQACLAVRDEARAVAAFLHKVTMH
jgi:hypothetical protein